MIAPESRNGDGRPIDLTSRGTVSTRTMRDEIRERLEMERESLLDRVSDAREMQAQSTSANTEAVGARDDDDGADLRVADALEAQFRDALDRVELALSRVDDPSFGICEACARDIPVERLLVVPETRHCVDCRSRSNRERRA